MAKDKKEKKIFFPTGCNLLDLVVGGGEGYGYESGHIINVVGDKSSGKSGIAIEQIAATKSVFKEKLKYKYDDAESGFTFNTDDLYGFKIEKERSDTVEKWYGNTRQFFESLKKNEIGIYILDSLDGLSSKEMEKRANDRFKAFKKGKEYDEGSYQVGKAKFLSQEFFPHITGLIEDKKAFLVIISQTRDKIGSMFKTKTRAGGKALDFYSHTILWLREICKIEKKNRVTGIIIEAYTKKNKTARPFRKCRFIFLFDYGIDNTGSNVDYLFDLRTDTGLLKKSAEHIQFENNKKIINIKNMISFLKENKEWCNKYENDDPANGLKGEDKINSIIEWIQKNKDIKKEYDKIFGSTMTRNELINWIEQDENRIKELTKRVREKWEMIEQEIKTKRIKKYSIK